MPQLLAGAAATDITPTAPVHLAGFASRDRPSAIRRRQASTSAAAARRVRSVSIRVRRRSPSTSAPARARSSTFSAAASSVTPSAAAEGVGARTSATRSEIVTSTSCPTADTVGIGQFAIARASDSSLNSHRSSIDPPPLVSTITSDEPSATNRSSACSISSAAPSPWTRQSDTSTRVHGARRRITASMSRSAAPDREVTIPTVIGTRGSGRFLAGSSSPSA